MAEETQTTEQDPAPAPADVPQSEEQLAKEYEVNEADADYSEDHWSFDGEDDDLPFSQAVDADPAKAEQSMVEGSQVDGESQGLSRDLLTRAEQFGFELGDLADVKSDEELTFLLQEAERLASDPQFLAELEAEGQEGQEEAIPENAFGVDLGELMEPEVQDAFNQMTGHYNGFTDRLQQLEAVVHAQRESAIFDEFDGLIGALGEEYHELLGEGGRNSLDSQSEQFGNRKKVLEAIQTLSEGHRVRGNPDQQFSDLFQQGLRTVFGDKQEELARKQIGAKMGNRQKQFMARPSHRSTQSDDSDETRAKRFIAGFLKDRGGFGD